MFVGYALAITVATLIVGVIWTSDSFMPIDSLIFFLSLWFFFALTTAALLKSVASGFFSLSTLPTMGHVLPFLQTYGAALVLCLSLLAVLAIAAVVVAFAI